jgi:hypothetical protein
MRKPLDRIPEGGRRRRDAPRHGPKQVLANSQAKSMEARRDGYDFISDPSLLRSSFEGPSWDRWRAVLRAAFALPMSRHDRELFAEVAGDRAPPKRRVKELVAAVGRGGGKDSIAAALATFIATTGDFTRLRPGERGTVMTLATDRDQAGIAFSYIRAHLEETPLLAPLIRKVDSDRIALRNGAEILVQTNKIRAPRAARSPVRSTTRRRTGGAKTSRTQTPR